MNDIKGILEDIKEKVPGVIGLILIDSDGLPIEVVGNFDSKSQDLGALLSACFHSYNKVGVELSQELESVIVEYGDLKLCQNRMPRGILTIIAEKQCYVGMIRLEAKRAIEKIAKIMADTSDLRKKAMKSLKFRLVEEGRIDDLITKLRKEIR